MEKACQGCTARYPGCHGKCKKYAEFREQWERAKAYNALLDNADATNLLYARAMREKAHWRWNKK